MRQPHLAQRIMPRTHPLCAVVAVCRSDDVHGEAEAPRTDLAVPGTGFQSHRLLLHQKDVRPAVAFPDALVRRRCHPRRQVSEREGLRAGPVSHGQIAYSRGHRRRRQRPGHQRYQVRFALKMRPF